MHLPEVIILSTQRSGTHLLESFLAKHPMFHAKGEMFLKYKRTRVLVENEPGKINIGILMYSELKVFSELGGLTYSPKFIHLIRDARNVALSRQQMKADRLQMGDAYQAHYHIEDLSKPEVKKLLDERHRPDVTTIEALASRIAKEQQIYRSSLSNISHLEIHYEEIVKNNETVSTLDREIQNRLLSFLNVPGENYELYTTYYKTGITQG